MSDVAEVDLVRQWRDLMARHARVATLLECRLQERHGIGVNDFEALEALATRDEKKCRSADITEAVHLSQSATSRLVGRLEREGLVERVMCPADRRGIFVELTEEGRRRYLAAKPTHREVLAETLEP